MCFEEANDIIGRRNGYTMGKTPTLVEEAEAEMAFGIDKTKLCYLCERYVKCHMVDTDNINCNFFKKDKSNEF